MLGIHAGALAWLSRIERRVSIVSLAAHAEMTPLIGPLSPSVDVLTVLFLGEG